MPIVSAVSGATPPPVITIRELKDHVGEEVTLQGWLYNKTGKGKLHFLQVRDGSGMCQAVVFRDNVAPDDFEIAKSLTQESSVIVSGLVRAEPRAPASPAAASSTSATSKPSASPTPIPSPPRNTGSSS